MRCVRTCTVTGPAWELQVLGKGRKQRTVPLSLARVRALREHWGDLGADFEMPPASAPLMRPVWLPPRPRRSVGVQSSARPGCTAIRTTVCVR
jgi:integrase